MRAGGGGGGQAETAGEGMITVAVGGCKNTVGPLCEAAFCHLYKIKIKSTPFVYADILTF